MLEHLFGSKTRLKLLRLFFRNPKKAFFVRELTRLLDTQINAVRRELSLLIDSGLVIESDTPIQPQGTKKTKPGATLRKYYLLNTDSIIYSELDALLAKGQLMGEQQMMNEIQKKVGDIDLFLLTGRFTMSPNASSDLLLVGDIEDEILAKIVAQYEKDFGFDIRYTVMTKDEYFDRQHVMDKFLYSLFENKHVVVVDRFISGE